jgi:nucleoside-diphosphate-sugar epimerase
MTSTAGRTVALTGATGFLGSHIADRLLAAGHRVRASIRPTSSLRWLEGKPLETVTTDLLDADSCPAFLGGCDAVIHCAGVVSAGTEDDYRRGNVDTTGVLLEAARREWDGPAARRPAFVLISSLAAFGPAGLDRPATEDQPCRPITAYGRSKLAAEKLLLEADWPFRTAVLRPPGLYGPRDRDFLPLFQAARRGVPARIGTRLQGLSLVDGRDAAAGAVALLQADKARGVYFVDDGHGGYAWPEIAAALGAAWGRRVRTLTVPLGLLQLLARLIGARRAARSPLLNPDRIADLDTPGWVCDGSRLVADTGFTAGFDLTRGFADTVAHLTEQGAP